MVPEEIVMPEARLFMICVHSIYFRDCFQNAHSDIAAVIGDKLVICDHVIEDEAVLKGALLLDRKSVV